MSTFLRRRRWITGPPLPTWLNTILGASAKPVLQPALVRPNSIFALAAVLLSGLVFGPGRAWAQATNCSVTTTGINFATRAANEDWRNRATENVPTAFSYSQVGTTFSSSPNNATVSLTTAALNGAQTLNWTADYASSANSSTVTFNFGRAVSNVSIRVQDIDGVFNPATGVFPFATPSSGFVDEVTFSGSNSGAAVTPGLTKVVASSPYVAVAVNTTNSTATATGQSAAGNSSTLNDAAVTATFSSPVTSITLVYRNITPATTVSNQSVGIDNINWCRIVPTVANVTTAPVLSTATQAGIAGLDGQADGTLTYTIKSLPANGTLFYNNAGTYASVALNQTLTPAQAASLRYTPSTTYTGPSTGFTYALSDNATPAQTTGNATYTIPLQYPVACAPGTATPFAFSSRPAGEDWTTRTPGVAAPGTNATLVSAGGYTSGATTTSAVAVGTFNNVTTLAWQNQFATGSSKTSSMTFTFSRPVSNFTVQVQDIDLGTGYTDQVTFAGANGGTTVIPALTAANPNAGIVTVNGNVATGQAGTTSTVDGTVTAYFGSPITSLTLTYANPSTATTPGNQIVGIDQMTWCEAAPVAVDVTSAAVLSSVGATSISALASTIDSAPATYTLASIPTTAQGVLSYNSSGTTYTNITAANYAGLTLTAAQAASLRFAPVAGTSGNVTFTYKVKDGNNQTSANTATYTIPVSNAACASTTSLNFRSTTPVPDDWKSHAALAVPGTSTATTISSGGYSTPNSATGSTLATVTTANGLNGVQTLQWLTDYANQTDNTSTVTFTFSRPVSNYTLRVQDIDKAENAASNGVTANAFIDQVTFAGDNSGTPVLPSLAPLGTANTVTIAGNVATGTSNITNTTDGTVTAYFASPVTSVTITYRNLSTFQADPTANAIGLEEMTWCRLAPVAANITNTSHPSGQAATAVNSLSATADGTITTYTITALPAASQGTFYVNGVALTASTLTLTPAQAAQLTFAPAVGFGGNAGFSYYATDDAGTVSNTATYAVPVTNTGAAGTPTACAIPGKDGSPTLSANPNTYYPATASAAAGATILTVGAGTTGSAAAANTISKGDLLLVIQMQGADIDYTNSDSYGDGVAGGGASGTLPTNYQAGSYEYVVATNATPIAVGTGGTITLASGLLNSYVSAAATTTDGPRRFQVVRIPQYGNLTLGGTLTATPWNGSIGGIIALDVAGQTNFSGNNIDASGRGFRGGGGRTQATAAGANTDYVNGLTVNAHAQKGEGTAGTPRYVNVPATTNDATTNATTDTSVEGYPGGSNGRGAPGNAGGGGSNNIDNSGGGGGANGGNGGRGGNNFAANLPIGGEPGTSFTPASSSRLVLGGGGGAGTTNNNTGTPANGLASSGAAGGGLVLLRTGSVVGAGTIVANGGNANNSVADDGSGGGGAGGSILVTANNPAGLANLTLTANGGNGGSNTGSSNGTGPHGPGGGGGGGVVLANGAVASASAAAGANGTTRNTTTTTVAFGAAAGAAGITNTQISNAIAGSTVGTTCAADVTTAITGPATLTPAQPSGTYTVTFANEGPSTAQSVTRQVTLPAGATNIFLNGVAYTPTMANTIDFGTATSLASGATSSFTFSFTPATTATGTQTITSNVTTTSGQGADSAPNTSAIQATVPPVADVAATIVPGATVPAGTLASATTPPSFTATFTNNGPANATGVVATVQLPKNLTNVTATNGGVYDAATGLVSYSGLTILVNGTSTVSVIKFDAPANGLVVATASTTTATSQAGQTANDRQAAALPLSPAFDLATSISGPATSVAGDLVTLALTTSNNGPSPAATVVQTAQLATGLTNVYVSNGGYYNATTSTATVNYGGVSYSVPAGGVIYPPLASLPSGQTVANTVSFVLPATGFVPSATVTPSTSATGETNPTNNLAYLNGGPSTSALAVAPAAGNPANVYTKISSLTATTTVGGPVTLTVTTGNNGSATSAGGSATGVVQTVQLLPGFAASALQVDGQTGTLNSATNTITFATSGVTYATYNTLTGLVTFPAITQASGASVSHTIAFAAPASTGNNGQLLATAMVTAANADPVPADNTAATAIVLAPAADLVATLTGPATATAGQVVTYTATFTNNGPMAASGYNAGGAQTAGVFETAQLPAGLSGVTVTNTAGTVVTGASYDPLTGVVTFPALTADAVGTTQAYTLSFVAPARSLVASASVSSAAPDATPANNSASVSTTIAPAADLVTSVSGPATAVIGNAVTYTVTTANNGPNAAAVVVPTLQLPTGFTVATLIVGGQTGTLNTTTGNIDYASGAKYNTSTGVVTFVSTGSLASGSSILNRVTYLMPDASGGQVAGVATATSTTADLSPGNNSGSVATSIAPATPATADLITSIAGAPTSAAAGVDITFTAKFRNNGTAAAANVVPTLQLPAGLTIGSISDGGVYNPATGLVTWPTIASQPSGDLQTYTVVVKAPASGPVIAYSSASSDTSEPNTSTAQTNTVGTASVTITPVFDEVTRLGGPATALAGTTQTYTVTTVNNGPSPTNNATTQVVTLPAGVAPVTGSITGGGAYSPTNNTITWTIASGQLAGAAGAAANTFALVQPAAGVALTASVSVTGDSNPDNNTAALSTTVPNQVPTAAAVVNSLAPFIGNTAITSPTAPYGVLISPLVGADPENALATSPYTIVALPDAGTQGTLYYSTGGTAYTAATIGQALTTAQAATLRFMPKAGYVGNYSFTYAATDAAGNQSAAATYTIPVGSDLAATYATYNTAKGGTNKYVTNDVLAQFADASTDRYNSAGNLYDAQGNALTGTSNGLSSAVITAGTLPAGVSLDAATGRLYVSDASQLVNYTTARTYTVTVATTDANGGVTTQAVTFTIGAYPLPVVLTEFTAQAVQNHDALLKWATASEKNNDHFEVERSFDGTSFTTIGTVAGHGTTSAASAYTLTDAGVAAKASGPVYYRLRQVDLDGTSAYSPVRSVRFTTSVAAAPLTLSLFPNPAQTSTQLDLSQLPATGTYQVLLLDATGRTVRTASLAGGLPQPLSLTELAAGTYHVVVAGQLADGTAFRQTLRLTKE